MCSVDSHPSRTNAVVVAENAVEVVACGPPCGYVIRGGIVVVLLPLFGCIKIVSTGYRSGIGTMEVRIVDKAVST